MNDDRSEAEFDQARARRCSSARAEAAFDFSFDWPRELLAGNAIVDDIHRAADRVRSIEKRGRTAHDFDDLDRQWLDGDGVIRAHVGRIDGGEAILENANPIFTQSTNHRTACARTKISGADAGFAIKRFTDGRLEPKLRVRRQSVWSRVVFARTVRLPSGVHLTTTGSVCAGAR